MDAVQAWYERSRAHLRAAGVADVEPLAPGEKALLLRFRHRGGRFVMGARPHGKGAVPLYGVVELPPSPTPRPRVERLPEARLRARTAMDARGLAWGLNAQPATGDAAFHERVYVESEAPAGELAAVLGSAATRGATAALVADPDVLTVSLAELECLATVAVLRDDPAKLAGRLDALGWLASTLPQPTQPPRARLAIGMRAEGALLLVAGMLSWWFPLIFSERFLPYRGSFGATVAVGGLALFVVAMGVQVARHRTRTTGLRWVMGSFASLTVACPSLVASALLVLNAELASERRVRQVVLEDFECGAAKRGRVCTATVRGLGERETWSFVVPTDVLSKLERQRRDDGIAGACGPAELTEREGALGYALLDRLRRTPNGEAYYTRCASDE